MGCNYYEATDLVITYKLGRDIIETKTERILTVSCYWGHSVDEVSRTVLFENGSIISDPEGCFFYKNYENEIDRLLPVIITGNPPIKATLIKVEIVEHECDR